jgi:hypothetical protein
VAAARNGLLLTSRSLTGIVSGDSPYLKTYAGLNLVIFSLLVAGLAIGGLWGTMEVMFNDMMKFEYVSEQFATGAALFATSGIMLERNYRWFIRCQSREFGDA